MGFDLYGENQENEKGKYFRNNCWWWRPLWNYVCIVCDKILTEKEMVGGAYNDGKKIVAPKAIKIAKKLQETIDNGEAKKYEKEYKKNLESMEQEECIHCKGTGKRNDEYVKGKCNGCEGTGKTDSFLKSYPFSVENLKDFIEFAQNSGGFRIY